MQLVLLGGCNVISHWSLVILLSAEGIINRIGPAIASTLVIGHRFELIQYIATQLLGSVGF